MCPWKCGRTRDLGLTTLLMTPDWLCSGQRPPRRQGDLSRRRAHPGASQYPSCHLLGKDEDDALDHRGGTPRQAAHWAGHLPCFLEDYWAVAAGHRRCDRALLRASHTKPGPTARPRGAPRRLQRLPPRRPHRRRLRRRAGDLRRGRRPGLVVQTIRESQVDLEGRR